MELKKTFHLPDAPTPRIEVQKMCAYTAPLEGRRKLLRLDFNENTVGPSPKVIGALRNIPSEHIAIYPEYNGVKEALKENLSGFWSRRIDDINRLVYAVDNSAITIISCRYHY